MQVIQETFPGGARLTGYLRDVTEAMPDYNRRPTVLILPGGGYERCSAREGDPVAMQFLAAGYHAFVLNYSTGESAEEWHPMLDASRAMVFLRKNGERLRIRPDKIAVCGFSAGGHLAACTGLLWDADPVRDALGEDAALVRPDAMILCYPVITSGEYGHAGSFDRIAGSDPALRERFSLEKQVRPDTPPVFLWHAVADATVPVQNSLMLVEQLEKQDISYEMHLFGGGKHGMGLCTVEVDHPDAHIAHWFTLCREWLDNTFDFHAGV